jgi:hypothetical protein
MSTVFRSFAIVAIYLAYVVKVVPPAQPLPDRRIAGADMREASKIKLRSVECPSAFGQA